MVYTKNVRVPFDCILPAIAFFCGFFDKWPRCGWSLSKSILFLALIANSWARQVVAISVFIMRCAQSIADNQFSLGNSFSLGCRLSIVDLSFDFLASLVPHFSASSSVGAMGAKAPSKDKDYTTWIAREQRSGRGSSGSRHSVYFPEAPSSCRVFCRTCLGHTDPQLCKTTFQTVKR